MAHQATIVTTSLLLPVALGFAYHMIYGSPHTKANYSTVIDYCINISKAIHSQFPQLFDRDSPTSLYTPSAIPDFTKSSCGVILTQAADRQILHHEYTRKIIHSTAFIVAGAVILWAIAILYRALDCSQMSISTAPLHRRLYQAGIRFFSDILFIFYIPWRVIFWHENDEFGFFVFLPIFIQMGYMAFSFLTFSDFTYMYLGETLIPFTYACLWQFGLWDEFPRKVTKLLKYCVPPFYIGCLAAPHIYIAYQDPDSFPVKAYAFGHLMPIFPLLIDKLSLEGRYALLQVFVRNQEAPTFRLTLRYYGVFQSLAVIALVVFGFRLLVSSAVAFIWLSLSILAIMLFAYDWAPIRVGGWLRISQATYVLIQTMLASLSFAQCIINILELLFPNSWLITFKICSAFLLFRIVIFAHIWTAINSGALHIIEDQHHRHFSGILYKTDGINGQARPNLFYIWRGALWAIEPNLNFAFLSPLETYLMSVYIDEFNFHEYHTQRYKLLVLILLSSSRYGPRVLQIFYAMKIFGGDNDHDIVVQVPRIPYIPVDYDAGNSYLFAFYTVSYGLSFVNDLIRAQAYNLNNVCAVVYLGWICLPLLRSLKIGSKEELQKKFGTPIVVSARRIPASQQDESSDGGNFSWVGPYGHQVMVIGNYKYELRRPSEGVYEYRRGLVRTETSSELYYEHIRVGWTRKTAEEIHECCTRAYAIYKSHRYHSLFHNCGDFLEIACKEVIEMKDVGWYVCSDENNRITRRLLFFAVYEQCVVRYWHDFPLLSAAWLMSMAMWYLKFKYIGSDPRLLLSIVF